MNTCPHRSVSLVELGNLTPIPFSLSLDASNSTSLSSFDYRLYRKSHLIISPIPFKLSFQRPTEPPSSADKKSPFPDELGPVIATPTRLSLGGSLPRRHIASTMHHPISLSPTNPQKHPNTNASTSLRTIPPAIPRPPVSPTGSPPRRPKRKAHNHPTPPPHEPPVPAGRKHKRRRRNRRRGAKQPSPAPSDDSIDRQVMTAATVEEMGTAAEMWVQKTMRKLGYPELLTSGGSG